MNPSYAHWRENKNVIIFLITFVACCAATYFWSEYPALSLRGILKILQQVSLFFIFCDFVGTSKRFEIFLKWFLIVNTLVVVNGFYQYFTGYDFIRQFQTGMASSGPRVTAAFKSYGIFASYLICTIPFLIAIVFHQVKNKGKLLTQIFTVFLLLGSLTLLFFTRSRGAFVAIGGACFLFLLIKRQWKLIIAFGLAAGLCLLFVIPKSMIIHLGIDGKEQTIVERYFLWDRALQVIEAKPLGGTGLNTYAESHAKYDKTQDWRVRDYYAHNGYLQLAAETGLISLFFFLCFLLAYFRHLFDSMKLVELSREHSILLQGLFVGLLSFILFMGVDTVFHNPQPVMIFWYLTGVGVALIRLGHSKTEA